VQSGTIAAGEKEALESNLLGAGLLELAVVGENWSFQSSISKI